MAAAAALIAFAALAPAASAQDDPAEELSRSSPWSMSLTQVPPHVRHKVLIQSIVTSRRFADTYAGLVARGDGGLTVYATPSGMPAIAAELERELGPPASGTYELRPAKLSYKALEALTQRVVGDVRSLESDGVEVFSFGPDPASNTVRVDLANYTAARAKSVTDRFGDDVSVAAAKHPEPLLLMSNRYYDVPAWYNGDVLFAGDDRVRCTHSYAVRGRTNGTVYGMTAGHCGGPEYRTNMANYDWLGGVSSNYYDPNDPEAMDLATFRCPKCFTGGTTWYEGPSKSTTPGVTHNLKGVCSWCGLDYDPPQRVAMNGAGTGQVAGNDIIDVNKCFKVIPSNNVSHWRCHLSRAVNPQQTKACGAGDSGGPVYQRTSTNTGVYAAGSMVAGNAEGWICSFHDLYYILAKTNTALLYY